MKPYWKSKSHIAIFITFVAWHVLTFASFIVDMVFYLKDPQPVDPNAPSRITTLVLVILFLLSFIPDFVFFFDLFKYIRIKRRLSYSADNNVEIVTNNNNKEEAEKEAKKLLRRNEIIADIKESGDSIDALYEFKNEGMKTPSGKLVLATTFYAAGIPLLVIFLLTYVFFFLFNYFLDIKHPLQSFINASAIEMGIILLFIIFFIIFFIIQMVKNKKNPPKEVGIRIYNDYLEQYVIPNKENIKETRYKVAFNNMKRLQTKRYYFIKGKVNNQIAVISIIKNESPEASLILIEDKYLKAKEAKKAKKAK